MSIRTRIIVFQAAVIGFVLLAAVLVAAGARSALLLAERARWANDQLAAITALSASANRYSEQIAELLLIGEPEREDFESARDQLVSGLDALGRLIEAEVAFLGDGDRVERERDEAFRLARMRLLHAEIDPFVDVLLRLREEGRMDEAVGLFRREIENRLDAEFEGLIRASVLDEEEEVRAAEAEMDGLWRVMAWAAAAALSAVLACAAAGALFSRSLTRPIGLLTRGAEEVRRGNLRHRIAWGRDGRDELARLAVRFDEMAARLEEQRAGLLRARAGLEREVAARTEELAAANRRLTELDRLRVRFLAEISHELRTPLTVLRGEAEVGLRHGPKPEAAYRDALERIVAVAHDMTRLIDDLLFVARSEFDAVRFDFRRCSLQDVAADAVREGGVLGRGRGVELRHEAPEEPIWVEADPNRLRQAFVVVIDNAIKHSPPGGRVEVRVTGSEGLGELEVRDEGGGIPPADLPHVFERFYRGRTSSGETAGSGLGLSIARWLVERHRGAIELASEWGSHTEVRIRIPRLGAVSLGKDTGG